MTEERKAGGPGITLVSLKGEERTITRDTPAAARKATVDDDALLSPRDGARANDDILGGLASTSSAPPAPPPPSGIELEEAKAQTPKRVRSELLEWSQSIQTHPQAATVVMPEFNGDQEKAPLAPPRAAAAEPRSARGLVLTSVGVLGLIAVGYVWGFDGPHQHETDATEGASTPPSVTTSAFELRPENAPDCWTTDEGFHFQYKSASGTEKRVATIEDVPVLYRMTASCLRD